MIEFDLGEIYEGLEDNWKDGQRLSYASFDKGNGSGFGVGFFFKEVINSIYVRGRGRND